MSERHQRYNFEHFNTKYFYIINLKCTFLAFTHTSIFLENESTDSHGPIAIQTTPAPAGIPSSDDKLSSNTQTGSIVTPHTTAPIVTTSNATVQNDTTPFVTLPKGNSI